MKWTNFGSTDEIVLKECADASVTDPRSIWWHRSSRLKDGTCCGSLRAWNTDQCIDGRNPTLGKTKLTSYTCNLDSGLEALLQLNTENKEEFSLVVGRHCVGVEKDSTLKIVDCEGAPKWRKRSAFTPIEYDLLGADSKNNWESVS